MSDRLDRALELLDEAQVRLAGSRGTEKVWHLIDVAVWKIRDELADRMLEAASAEIAELVDIHGLIDDVGGCVCGEINARHCPVHSDFAGDDRAQGFR